MGCAKRLASLSRGGPVRAADTKQSNRKSQGRHRYLLVDLAFLELVDFIPE